MKHWPKRTTGKCLRTSILPYLTDEMENLPSVGSPDADATNEDRPAETERLLESRKEPD